MTKFNFTRRKVLLSSLATGATLAMPGILRAQSNEPIRVWTFESSLGESDWMKSFMAEYEKQSGNKVDFQARGWSSQRTDLLAALAGGDVPDLLIRGHGELVAELGDAQALLPLDDLPGWEETASNFLPNYVQELVYQGKHYGLPWGANVAILGGNKPMMAAAGIEPKLVKYGEFRGGLERVTNKEKGVYGMVIPCGGNLDAAFRFAAWLYKAGGRVLSDDWTKPVINQEAGVRALQFWVDALKDGLMPPGVASFAWADSAQYWSLGKACFATEGNYWAGAVNKQFNFPIDDVQYMPVPMPEQAGEFPSKDHGEVYLASVFRQGKNNERAWELLKFLRQSHVDVYFAETQTSNLPVSKAAYELDVKWKAPGHDVFREVVRNSASWPAHPRIGEIQAKVGEAVNATISGSMTARDALNTAASNITDILS